MLRVSCMQLIFSRVEEKYSPQRYSGFQTVFKNRNLSNSEVEIIEERVKCFKPISQEVTRYQFFSLPSGRLVLGHSKIIDSDPIIIDKERREGMFLAHCLVLESKEFTKINNDPFRLFDTFPFLTTARELGDQFIRVEEIEQNIEIEINPSHLPLRGRLWWHEADKLYIYAKSAESFPSKSNGIGLVGNNSQVNELVSAFIHFTLPSIRLKCSFDTYVDNCMDNSKQYWLVGSSQNIPNRSISLNAEVHDIVLPESVIDSNDIYSYWLVQAVKSAGEKVFVHVQEVQELCEALSGRIPFQKVADFEAYQSFFYLSRKPITSSLARVFSEVASPRIANEVVDFIYSHDYRKIPVFLTINPDKRADIFSSQIREWMISIAPRFNEVDTYECKRLRVLAEKARDNVLLFWISLIAQDERSRKETITRMNEDEFKDSLTLLGKPFPHHLFIEKNHLQGLLKNENLILDNVTNEEYIKLVQAILAIGEFDALDYISTRIHSLSNEGLTRIEKMAGHRHLPLGFQKALRMHRDQLSNVQRNR